MTMKVKNKLSAREFETCNRPCPFRCLFHFGRTQTWQMLTTGCLHGRIDGYVYH